MRPRSSLLPARHLSSTQPTAPCTPVECSASVATDAGNYVAPAKLTTYSTCPGPTIGASCTTSARACLVRCSSTGDRSFSADLFAGCPCALVASVPVHPHHGHGEGTRRNRHGLEADPCDVSMVAAVNSTVLRTIRSSWKPCLAIVSLSLWNDKEEIPATPRRRLDLSLRRATEPVHR